MKTYQQVLCPVDFSESSLNAARWGWNGPPLAKSPWFWCIVMVYCYRMPKQLRRCTPR